MKGIVLLSIFFSEYDFAATDIVMKCNKITLLKIKYKFFNIMSNLNKQRVNKVYIII